MLIELPEPLTVYNKQWKKVFTITHINEHQQLVDALGVIHNPRALREVKLSDNSDKLWRV